MDTKNRLAPTAVAVAILAISVAGCSIPGSGSGSGAIGAPSGLTATPRTDALSITLTWSASTSVGATFDIYRGTVAGGESATPIGTSSTTSYTDNDSSLTVNTTYYYDVTAVVNGAQSGASNEASATTAPNGNLGAIIQ